MSQEKPVPIFNRLKAILERYEDPLKLKFDLDSKYDLWSFKDVDIFGRKRKEARVLDVLGCYSS